jgi:hypothetical protein
MSDGLEEQISFGSNFFLSFFLFEFKDLHVNYTFVEGRWNLTECRVSVKHISIKILFQIEFLKVMFLVSLYAYNFIILAITKNKS